MKIFLLKTNTLISNQSIKIFLLILYVFEYSFEDKYHSDLQMNSKRLNTV